MTDCDTRHRVFISYYHKDDQNYKDAFIKNFGDMFINKCVGPGEISDDNSTDYIKRLIREDYITDSSVLVVLVGPHTYCRKHVDWEISAALNKKVGGYSGLLGIMLPTYSGYSDNKYDPGTIPPRFNDNLESKYAKFIGWTENRKIIGDAIHEAFCSRKTRCESIVNSRPQFAINICS